MPGGARLTNIASGLCGPFASRNNDLDGYWSTGKLRSLAKQHGRTTILLDVLTSSIHPPSSEFAPVLARYCCLLVKLADVSRIRLEEITKTHITLDLAPSPCPRISYYKPRWGQQFTLTVIIKADGKPPGIVYHRGYCRSHDPAREHRSSRPAVC